ncbi:gastrula zinc finger protein XlCGF7.1-like isoform X2 [Anopheles bellator]|uniref:gastrula zinc finger protein XlCGF7.1-like isoform X2 n=1 Tax=Anopheles bellator TaxID=139047 RepID=UPI002647CF92|nr:gastrula zinc finger protein XlCGF7.1-like isoform X2 [Anopheles bellator]
MIHRYLFTQDEPSEQNGAKHVCAPCLLTVKIWHRFYEMCHRNAEVYRQWVQSSDSRTVQFSAEREIQEIELRKGGSGTEECVALEIEFKAAEDDKSCDDEVTLGHTNVLDAEEESDHSVVENQDHGSSSSSGCMPAASPEPMGRRETLKRKRKSACEICGQYRSNMAEHMRAHKNDRRFKCPYCPKSFVSASNRHSHVNIHTRQKMYKCDLCAKEYPTLNGLKQHRVTHEKKRVYLCPICGKSYYQPTNYARHRRTHLQERKIQCDSCDKVFMTRGDLRKHTITHMNVKPFACQICDQRFNRRDNLKTHLKIHLAHKHGNRSKEEEAF